MRWFMRWLAFLFDPSSRIEASGIAEADYLALEKLLDKLEHAILDCDQMKARKNVREFLYARLKIS